MLTANCRRAAALFASIAATWATQAFAASVEFSGTSFGTGTNLFPFDVAGATPAEMLFGTYSAAGGTTPAGVTVLSGGIDSKLDLFQGATLLSTNDDINGAADRDSEIRTTGFATGRAGGTVRAPITAGSYELRLSRNALNSGAWSAAIASSSGGVTLRHPTFNAGQGIDNILVSAARLSLDGGTYSVGTQTSVEGGVLTLSGGASLSGNFRAIGASSIQHNQATLTAGTFQLGSATNSSCSYILSSNGTLNATSMTLSTAASADSTFMQTSGSVNTTFVTLGTTALSTEKSVLRLNGGTFIASSLVNDGNAANFCDLQGGTLRLPSPTATNLIAGQSLLWGSGTLSFSSAGTNADLRRIFGAGLTLGAGQILDLGNSGSWNTLVTLNGGTLSVDHLDANAALTWNAGTLDLEGSALGILPGGVLGAIVDVSTGKTLQSNGANISAGGTLLVTPGGLAVIDNLTNSGSISLGGIGAVIDTTSITNSGNIAGTGILRGTLTNGAAGTINLAANDALRHEGVAANAGAIRLTGGSFTATSTLTNQSGGTITGRGTLAASQLDNSGIATFSAGLSDLDAVVNNAASGKIIVTGGATLTVYHDVINTAGSEFRVSQNASVAFLGAVTGLNAITGTGTKYFEGPGSGARLAGGGATVVEASGSLTTAGIDEASLTLRGPAKFTAGSATSKLKSLAFEGGTLDLTDNKLAVDYDSASPAGVIRAAIKSTDLFSTAAGATNHTIGYAEASAVNATTFGGVTVDGTSVLIRWTLKGDATLDGTVNFQDLVSLAQNYNGTNKVWSQGDFNYDDTVNFNDLVSLAQNYNASALDGASASPSPAFAADWALAQSLVPEPALLSIVGLIAMTLRRKI